MADSHKQVNEYMEKYLTIHTAFLFLGQVFWKEDIEDSQSKLIGLERFKLLSTFKDDNTFLHKVGLNIKE